MGVGHHGILLAGLLAGSGPAGGRRHGEVMLVCTDCHPAGIAKHLRDWDRSVHARAGVSCLSCHPPAPVQPHGPDGRPPPPRQLRNPTNIVRICGACHPEVEAVFRRSPHFQLAADGARAPACGDCHTTAGGSVLAEEEFSERCGTCHTALDADPAQAVSTRAVALLNDLRRVTLARAMVADRIARLRRAGTSAGELETALRAIDLDFHTIAAEWHRFDLEAAARRSHRALVALEALNHRLEAP